MGCQDVVSTEARVQWHHGQQGLRCMMGTGRWGGGSVLQRLLLSVLQLAHMRLMEHVCERAGRCSICEQLKDASASTGWR